VGAAIGFPEPPAAAENEDVFDAASILDDPLPEEIVLDNPVVEEPAGEPDFDMVDNVFGETSAPAAELQLDAAPPALGELEEEISFNTNPGGEGEASEKTIVGFMAPPPPAPRKPEPKLAPFQSSPSTAIDPAEARELRSRVTELTGNLEDARTQASELEAKVRELESQLETRQTELDAARTSTSKGDSKEVFALKDAANKKDKEILRLKNELNAKEQEIVELREKENTLEQAASESSGDMAKKDAQLKSLQTRADQLAAERKKIDQQLLQSREEGRGNSARLTTLQADYDAQQARLAELEAQLEPMRQAQSEAESARSTAEAELSEARGEIDALKSQLDDRSREADDLRTQHEQAQMDLDSLRGQLASQTTSFADEMSGLRNRITEAEADARKHEERAARHQARVKAQQAQFDRLRTSLQGALATLDEAPAEGEDLELDELAEA
jgi:chromosome segregation ATPase